MALETNYSEESFRMPILDNQLQAIRLLDENWDGYGAAAPIANVVDFAKILLNLVEAELLKRDVDPNILHISPTRIGGVIIDWEYGGVEHELEINPDHSVSFLHLNKSSGLIETKEFDPPFPPDVVPLEIRQLLAA